MGRDRFATTIAALSAGASALILLAPLAGRADFGALADLLVGAAAACGVAAFGLAAVCTLRAQRAPRRAKEE